MDGILSEIKKLNKGDVVVGIDLAGDFTQLSYKISGSDNVETLPITNGGNDYLIPTLLFRRGEVNQWFAGREAAAQDPDSGHLIDNLLQLAETGASITLGEDTYTPDQLVALFLRRILSMAGYVFPVGKITSLMITVENLSTVMVETLRTAVGLLGLKTENIFFQNHMESFYYYTIYSPKELWNRNVVLFDFFGGDLKSYMLECNKNTTPIVAYISDITYETVDLKQVHNPEMSETDRSKLDNAFYIVCEELTKGKIFSSVYLIGDNFEQSVFRESVRYLCSKGRVFGGNNLYSKGACYGALNKVSSFEVSEKYVFLGNDKLKSNIGINALRQGEQVYFPLLDAGVNWFESEREVEVILDDEPKLDFVITPLTGKAPLVHEMILSDFPGRGARTSRIKIRLTMVSETKVDVTVTDLGFGELFPASNTEWNEVIEL